MTYGGQVTDPTAYAYIYIYIYMYMATYIYIYVVELLVGPSLAIFKVINWAKFAFIF